MTSSTCSGKKKSGGQQEGGHEVEAPSTPECQEGVLSQGGQHREEHSVVHHVQVEHYQGQGQTEWDSKP